MFQISIILDRLYVVVHIDTSTSRNQLTNNNVFFQTVQIVALAANCRIGQSLCGFLEGSGRQEAVGAEDALVIP